MEKLPFATSWVENSAFVVACSTPHQLSELLPARVSSTGAPDPQSRRGTRCLKRLAADATQPDTGPIEEEISDWVRREEVLGVD